MLRLVASWITGAVLATLVVTGTSHAQMAVPPVPASGYVLDQTETLTPDQITALNEQISAYKAKTSVQLAVLMVPKITSDDYLERYSLNVARTWGIGQKDKNNGALLLIAKNDRKLRIEVGTGLEGDLSDVRASRIIRDRITPEFRNNRYYEGIAAGIEGMTLAIGATNDPRLAAESNNSDGWGSLLVNSIIFGAFGISWLGSILGRTKSWWAGGVIGGTVASIGSFFATGGNGIAILIATIVAIVVGLGFDFIVSKNYRRARERGDTPAWWAGGTTLGGGGGGSGGFGGGGFGGGGASGDW
ncbi:MAG TPA: TPM domain-containing protein [Candidatus Saccharimonadales bacterium]|jgi:uncharacterized protein